MLKRRIGDQLVLISQPDHAAVSGYLIAHWGNAAFTKPGHYGSSQNPEELRAETIFAIAEHDNGWWEWEADPQLHPTDGLPLDLLEMNQKDGLERWHLGVPRFAEQHPYVALLISYHAYWLHAPRCEPDPNPAFFHPLFGDPRTAPPLKREELERAQRFVAEQKEIQERLIEWMNEEEAWAAAVRPENLQPHVRLLQLADALSLALCFGGNKPHQFQGIPRRNWDDRVTLELTPQGNKRIACHPYPFDVDPLPVEIRARVLPTPVAPPEHFQTWWQSLPRKLINFEYCSR